MMQHTTHSLETRGATIVYDVFGQGPPIVLVQGLGMPGAMWRELAGELAGHGLRAILIDNRGTGRSVNHRPLFLMRDLADDVGAVLAQACPDERACAVGISLGGMITQHVALRHGQRLRGLVLAATTCGLPHNLLKGAFVEPRALALLLKLSFMPKKTGAEEFRRLLAHPDSADKMPELLGRIERVFADFPTPPETYLRQLVAALFHSTGGRLEDIHHPTRVITGDSDFLIPPENSRLLASRLPNATLEIVERAGHIFPMERPGRLTRAILEIHQQTHTIRAAG